MGCSSFQVLQKTAVSAVWIFHAVLQWREAADRLSGHNIGLVPQREQHLLWQPVCHSLSIQRALSSQQSLNCYNLISTWATLQAIITILSLFFPSSVYVCIGNSLKTKSCKVPASDAVLFMFLPHPHFIPDTKFHPYLDKFIYNNKTLTITGLCTSYNAKQMHTAPTWCSVVEYNLINSFSAHLSPR